MAEGMGEFTKPTQQERIAPATGEARQASLNKVREISEIQNPSSGHLIDLVTHVGSLMGSKKTLKDGGIFELETALPADDYEIGLIQMFKQLPSESTPKLQGLNIVQAGGEEEIKSYEVEFANGKPGNISVVEGIETYFDNPNNKRPIRDEELKDLIHRIGEVGKRQNFSSQTK
jgi:hypothetical protein